ncbi:MAG: Unknown protein [uncultured Sulfurovum sp.]|uniref:RecF/RecN/SMC N-terminal domain-containing protein n=1 Tax=uncultured Sulfurovum sp. TaxID=269237 RepID=A0A6S6TNK2_9BACT|nr:MAG: Unknown protein [uncultured Sulfurovum sp.]
MVKISKVDIKNFKFYINESIDILDKNLLVYGENGVGKSSLYLSLYNLFYGVFDSTVLDNIEQFKNRNIENEEVELLVKLSSNQYIKIINTTITHDIILNKKNIYFLDYRFLENFIEYNDFFMTLNKTKNSFLLFDDIFSTIVQIEEEISDNVTNDHYQLLIDRRIELDNNIKSLLNAIENKTNSIIRSLKEKFSISFDYEESALDRDALVVKFYKPRIYIKLDGEHDFRSHFNESKIKILSLSLVFAIIKLNRENNILENDDSLKLLVLDDFLSSLDMGNRLYIMEYIFNNFEDYQKIVLTHNSLFFNVIKRLVHVHGQVNNWEYKNIYQSLNENGMYEPKFITRNDNYLVRANDLFNELEFEACGNFLRKEIERIITQAQFLFQTGKEEKLENAIVNIRKMNNHYINPNNLLKNINELLSSFKETYLTNEGMPVNVKLDILISKLEQLFENQDINSVRLNEILRNISFYQTILNQASHHEEDVEIFQKEYREAISDVEKLKDIFDEFNNLQSQQ